MCFLLHKKSTASGVGVTKPESFSVMRSTFTLHRTYGENPNGIVRIVRNRAITYIGTEFFFLILKSLNVSVTKNLG